MTVMMLKTHHKNSSAKFLILILLSFLISACNFTTGTYREVIDAQELINTSRYNEAIKKYEAVLSKNPPTKLKYKIYYQLAIVHYQNLLKPKVALDYFKKIDDVNIDKNLVELSQKKAAQVSFDNRLYKEAIKFLKNGVHDFKIGICYYELNDFNKASQYFEKVIQNTTILKTKPGEISKSYFYLGQIKSYENNWHEAVENWENTLKYSRDSDEIIQAKFYIANAYERVFELEKAYKYYYSIINFYPNPEIIKKRLERVYDRKLSRRR